jgi:hypothetical protein
MVTGRNVHDAWIRQRKGGGLRRIRSEKGIVRAIGGSCTPRLPECVSAQLIEKPLLGIGMPSNRFRLFRPKYRYQTPDGEVHGFPGW